jgi:hypothetical protein
MQQRKYLVRLPGSFRLDFEVFTAIEIKIMGPLDMAPTSLTGGYNYFRGYSVRIRQKIQVVCCSETSITTCQTVSHHDPQVCSLIRMCRLRPVPVRVSSAYANAILALQTKQSTG